MRNVLFLCTGNSTRSIMAEGLLRHWGDGMFGAFSAGSHPVGGVNPMALEQLTARGISTAGLHCKSWDDFARPDSPKMDLVITVCDEVANEPCPVLPGAPMQLHWGLPNPSAALGGVSAKAEAFRTVCGQLEQRIAQLVTIPFADRDPASVQADLEAIAGAAA